MKAIKCQLPSLGCQDVLMALVSSIGPNPLLLMNNYSGQRSGHKKKCFAGPELRHDQYSRVQSTAAEDEEGGVGTARVCKTLKSCFHFDIEGVCENSDHQPAHWYPDLAGLFLWLRLRLLLLRPQLLLSSEVALCCTKYRWKKGGSRRTIPLSQPPFFF